MEPYLGGETVPEEKGGGGFGPESDFAEPVNLLSCGGSFVPIVRFGGVPRIVLPGAPS